MRQLFKTGVLQLFCLQLIALLYSSIFSLKKCGVLYACVDRDTTIVCLSAEFNWKKHF